MVPTTEHKVLKEFIHNLLNSERSGRSKGSSWQATTAIATNLKREREQRTALFQVAQGSGAV